MKVYLDICAIQRPLDTYSHARIVLEAEAVLSVLELCEAGNLELVSSEVLEDETEQNPWPVRKEHAKAVLAMARLVATVDDTVEARAKTFSELGIKPLDAFHLAAAEACGVERFCTCDDRLLQKARKLPGLTMKVVSPIELIQEIET